MKWIRETVLSGDLVTGTFLNLGSHVTAEVASQAGFDWVLLDLEHGAGDRAELLRQLQAVESGGAVPIVRLGWNEMPAFKRTLDLGARGIMVPFVNTAEEASRAAASLQYPPDGERGTAVFCRATSYGAEFETYFAEANANLLSVVQIETAEAVKNADAIAGVDRVDVLFVGPMDLSVSLGMPRRFDEPVFREALSQVVAACRQHGKAAGILAPDPEVAGRFIELGFTFVAAGSDGAIVAAGLGNVARALNAQKS
jgi:4-hydroxy-2-oxoheptanedioate aldolase